MIWCSAPYKAVYQALASRLEISFALCNSLQMGRGRHYCYSHFRGKETEIKIDLGIPCIFLLIDFIFLQQF